MTPGLLDWCLLALGTANVWLVFCITKRNRRLRAHLRLAQAELDECRTALALADSLALMLREELPPEHPYRAALKERRPRVLGLPGRWQTVEEIERAHRPDSTRPKE